MTNQPFRCSSDVARRNSENAAALAAFGVIHTDQVTNVAYRDIRRGNGPTVFTIGYERRDSDDLLARLLDAGVEILVDIRERPFSRKPDFRAGPLRAACESAGIHYESWPRLGSTEHQRTRLKATGDIGEFRKRFRDFAKRGRSSELADLAQLAENKTVALICYERVHEECHRSVVADLLACINDATITAIT